MDAEDLKEKGIETFKTIAIIAVVIFIIYLVFFRETKEEKPIISEYEQRQKKQEMLKNEIIEKNNGIIVFDDQEFSFSKDIQDRMNDNFLIEGDVYDIYKENEKYFIKIEGYDYFGIFEIGSQNVQYIQNMQNHNNFFAVVKLNYVSKSFFDVNGEVDYDDVSLYKELSDEFLLKGELIDIKNN